MTTIINAVASTGLTQTADGSGIIKVQSNGVTTNALAWVNFNGTGTVAIRSSYNVSSITDNGTGDYTINFTNALSDANYAPQVSIDRDGTSGVYGMSGYSITRTTTTCRVITIFYTGAYYDQTMVSVAIFGN